MQYGWKKDAKYMQQRCKEQKQDTATDANYVPSTSKTDTA